MSEHTPGPSWYAEPHGERGLDGASCFRIVSGTPPRIIAITYAFTAEDDADARLMAAAPDLLEALKNLADKVDSYRQGYDMVGADLLLAVNAARAAIRKAEGGAS